MRKPIIAGNWKMNLTLPEAESLAKSLVERIDKQSPCDVVICPTFICLDRVSKILKGSPIKLGAQDVHWENQGAYTGKISVDMLLDCGVEYVIIGHSEQRSYFHESNDTVNKKIKKALSAGLIPIVCVGETLEERESNKTESVVGSQTQAAFAGISAESAARCVIAYEPVWAIGTGKTASYTQAQEVHAFIRGQLEQLFGAGISNQMQIQYGGSMKPENAKGLLAQTDIDGGLIGGAALKAESFLGIITVLS